MQQGLPMEAGGTVQETSTPVQLQMCLTKMLPLVPMNTLWPHLQHCRPQQLGR